MHDSTHETGKSRRKIDFFNTEQQTQAKHSRLLKTPTEPFGIVLLETQYSAEKNQVGINTQTNCIKTVFWLYFDPSIIMTLSDLCSVFVTVTSQFQTCRFSVRSTSCWTMTDLLKFPLSARYIIKKQSKQKKQQPRCDWSPDFNFYFKGLNTSFELNV